jgi:hypothetical protein
MNFSELRFWVYIAIILGAVLLVRPFFKRAVTDSDVAMSRYDKTTILIVGLFLLGCVSPLTLAIYLFVCLITYIGLFLFLRGTGAHRYAFLIVLVPLQLLPLLYYKYSHFIVNDILGQELAGLSGLIITVGFPSTPSKSSASLSIPSSTSTRCRDSSK